DVSYCAKLSSEELKNECSELVADAVIMEEAVKSMDATKCDAIQKTETKDLCRVQVDIATMDAEKVAEKNQQLSDNEMIFVEAQDKQDVGKCDQIVNDESKKQACKDGVYSILAAKEQNKEYCAKIVNGEQRELCESGF
ncbi:MAG TPA: hypothetical protein VI588_00390, partial [Candidatus Gracilibacteria bacterium]|nr:hypothetical protein [Candidatus Gracilibacteria bacterium]